MATSVTHHLTLLVKFRLCAPVVAVVAVAAVSRVIDAFVAVDVVFVADDVDIGDADAVVVVVVVAAGNDVGIGVAVVVVVLKNKFFRHSCRNEIATIIG